MLVTYDVAYLHCDGAASHSQPISSNEKPCTSDTRTTDFRTIIASMKTELCYISEKNDATIAARETHTTPNNPWWAKLLSGKMPSTNTPPKPGKEKVTSSEAARTLWHIWLNCGSPSQNVNCQTLNSGNLDNVTKKNTAQTQKLKDRIIKLLQLTTLGAVLVFKMASRAWQDPHLPKTNLKFLSVWFGLKQ